MYKTKTIENRFQYIEAQKLLVVADRMINQNGGLLKVPRSWRKARQSLASNMFFYELEKNMLPL